MDLKAIGGYFSFEGGMAKLPHGGVLLNSGRNALRWIIQTLGIRKLHLPTYTCPVVEQAVRAEGAQVVHYALGEDFLPLNNFPADEWVVYNNYFGVCGGHVAELASRHHNLIVDNAQAFYANAAGCASFYSPRKFFGVPDGGIAVIPGREEAPPPLEQDHSLSRLIHLFRRLEEGAEAGYADFHASEQQLDGAPLRAMSATTRAMLSCCDFPAAAIRRRSNFFFLHERLHSPFPFAMVEDDVPMVYPFVCPIPGLREKLIARRIFVPLYWPAISLDAWPLAGILPLPIDQRYDEEDMQRIVEIINE